MRLTFVSMGETMITESGSMFGSVRTLVAFVALVRMNYDVIIIGRVAKPEVTVGTFPPALLVGLQVWL